MSLTITVADPLAQRLQSEAASRKIPVEQFALEVLGQAVQGYEWPATNRRRLTLIRKKFAMELTPDEVAELQELQRQAGRYLETPDSEMLNDVVAMDAKNPRSPNPYGASSVK